MSPCCSVQRDGTRSIGHAAAGADLCIAASTDAFGSPGRAGPPRAHRQSDHGGAGLLPLGRELRRLKEPAGRQPGAVRQHERRPCAREAIDPAWSSWASPTSVGSPSTPARRSWTGRMCTSSVTPDEMRYVPAGAMETKIDVGQRACDSSGMMIEIGPAAGAGASAGERRSSRPISSRRLPPATTALTRCSPGSIRLESQFHILMETLEDGDGGRQRTGRGLRLQPPCGGNHPYQRRLW